MGQHKKKAIGFSAKVKVDSAPKHNPEVNEHLLQAVVAACRDNEVFKNEIINSLNDLDSGQ